MENEMGTRGGILRYLGFRLILLSFVGNEWKTGFQGEPLCAPNVMVASIFLSTSPF